MVLEKVSTWPSGSVVARLSQSVTCPEINMKDKSPDKPDFVRIGINAVFVLLVVFLLILLFTTGLRKDALHLLIVLSLSLYIVYLCLSFKGTDKLTQYFSRRKAGPSYYKFACIWLLFSSTVERICEYFGVKSKITFYTIISVLIVGIIVERMVVKRKALNQAMKADEK